MTFFSVSFLNHIIFILLETNHKLIHNNNDVNNNNYNKLNYYCYVCACVVRTSIHKRLTERMNYLVLFDFNIRSSISKNDRIFASCMSFIIISLTTSDPSANFDDNSSAYCIQTQFAQPDIQQLVGGIGIYRKY